MSRPVVHIGYHKTATTWFQEEVYPRSTSHRWIPRARARNALLKPFGLSFQRGEALAQLTDVHDPRPPIICEENLSGYIHNGGLHGLMAPEAARRIRETFPDALIVMVIRAQPAMVASTYVQYVRGGGTYGPGRYLFGGRWSMGALQHRYKAPRFDLGHFEYDRLVALYDSLFGRENVLVLPYEELCRDPEAFLATLERESGIRFDARPITLSRPNSSFGLVTLAVGRLLGLFTSRSVVNKSVLISIPGFYELRRLLLKVLGRIDRAASPRKILGRKAIQAVHEHFVDSNHRLLALRDLNLRSLNYPMDRPTKETAPEIRLSSRRTDPAIARVRFSLQRKEHETEDARSADL